MQVRTATDGDLEALAALRARLWPDASIEQHRDEMRAFLAGSHTTTLPLAVFVAQDAGGVVGFIEVGLRSHADGCDPTRACGFIEGWYVTPEHAGRGVGRALMDRAEAWARDQGCAELASDTWIDNEGSQRAHEALGFEVVDRCVHYRKQIGAPSGGSTPSVTD